MFSKEAIIAETFFRIPDKDGLDTDFKLNSTQSKLDAELSGRDIIPKARQEGVSSYFLARYLAACLSRRNVRAVVISHDIPSTQRLLKRVKYFIENFKGPAPVIQNMSANEITFPKMNSMFYIGTAGAKAFGRGDTITHLHCSEYAYWSLGDPLALLSGLLDAVPMSGEVAIESTGNGIGNDYHRRCVRAYEGRSSFRCHFFNWQDFPEYTLVLSKEEEEIVRASLDEEYEEQTLFANGVLSLGQIAWRRLKIEEKDYDLRMVRAEYPMSFDECFQASDDSLFAKVNYQPTERWREQGNHLWILDGHPVDGYHYSLGVDPSGGVGKDNACMEVFCVETKEQVAEWAWNRTQPDTLGQKTAVFGKQFNFAYVTVESNNHGPVTLDHLREDYPWAQIYSMPSAQQTGNYEDRSLMEMGFRTTQRTKPIIIGILRTNLARKVGDESVAWDKRGVIIHSPLLKSELSTFIENENGKLEGQKGCNDDRVIAAAQAVFNLERAGIFAGDGVEDILPDLASENDPFRFENIIKGMCNGSTQGLPISRQHQPGT